MFQRSVLRFRSMLRSFWSEHNQFSVFRSTKLWRDNRSRLNHYTNPLTTNSLLTLEVGE